jgi:hypothetical protein
MALIPPHVKVNDKTSLLAFNGNPPVYNPSQSGSFTSKCSVSSAPSTAGSSPIGSGAIPSLKMHHSKLHTTSFSPRRPCLTSRGIPPPQLMTSRPQFSPFSKPLMTGISSSYVPSCRVSTLETENSLLKLQLNELNRKFQDLERNQLYSYQPPPCLTSRAPTTSRKRVTFSGPVIQISQSVNSIPSAGAPLTYRGPILNSHSTSSDYKRQWYMGVELKQSTPPLNKLSAAPQVLGIDPEFEEILSSCETVTKDEILKMTANKYPKILVTKLFDSIVNRRNFSSEDHQLNGQEEIQTFINKLSVWK